MKKSIFLTYTSPVSALLLMVIFSVLSPLNIIFNCSAHSPHRPRSPRVAVHTSGTPGSGSDHPHHHHYVPKRPVPGSKGQQQVDPILTHDKGLLHDKEHLKEDLGDWVFADGKELTPEEMEFHYFKMHDYDNNSMLDGLEILQAISHILPMTDVDDDDDDDKDEDEGNEQHASSIDLSRTGDNFGRKEAKMSLSSSSGRLTLENQKMRLEAEMKRAELIKQREADFDYYAELIDKVFQEDDLNKDGYLSYFEYVAGRRRDEKAEKAKAHQAAMHSSTPY